MPTAVVLLAEGAEEMEVVILVDVLRRGGIEVTLAGLDGPEPVRCSRGVLLTPDVGLDAAPADPDVLVLPGGAGGAERLAASEAVGARLRARQETGRLVAAVCAAPLALVSHGVFPERARTCHPSVAERVGVTEVRPLIEDGPLVTGPGPGACFEVALAVVARLQGHERAAEVRGPLMLPA